MRWSPLIGLALFGACAAAQPEASGGSGGNAGAGGSAIRDGSAGGSGGNAGSAMIPDAGAAGSPRDAAAAGSSGGAGGAGSGGRRDAGAAGAGSGGSSPDAPRMADAPRMPDAPRMADAPRMPDAPVGPPPACNLAADFGAPVPLTTLNTTTQDASPSFSPDGQTLYFASTRAGGVGSYDIYAATRMGPGQFGPPALVGGVNSTGIDYGLTTTRDGLVAFFTSERTGAGVPGGANIWTATRTSPTGTFGTPTVVTALSSDSADSDVWLWGDGTLVFSSDRPGSTMLDLWSSTWSRAAGTFSAPTLLFGVNSSAREFGATTSADGLTLVFSSNRIASLDLFVARRTRTTDNFGTPAAIASVNSSGADKGVAISPDGCELVFVTTRATADDDLWYAKRP